MLLNLTDLFASEDGDLGDPYVCSYMPKPRCVSKSTFYLSVIALCYYLSRETHSPLNSNSNDP